MARKLLIGVVVVMFSIWAFAGENVKIATLDWSPYIGKSINKQGFIAQITRAALKADGSYNVNFNFMNWNRVIKMTKMGRYDAFGPAYNSRERRKLYYISDTIVNGPLVLFKLKSKKIKYKKLRDLKGYKIGVVRGYVNTVAFDKASYLIKEAAKDDLTNIKKLEKGRVDLFVCDKYVGLSLIKKYNPSLLSRIEVMKPALERKSLHMCFRKTVKDSKKKWAAFNRGLKIIKKNGTFRKIMRQNGF